MRFRAVLPFVALTAFALTPAAAQKRPTPEQRIDRLEKQTRQLQKRVFPKGEPADTAGFSDDPAATQSSVNSITNRLDAVERQLADILRQAEENGNRVGVMEADIARLRAEQDQRFRALENSNDGAAPASTDADDQSDAPPPKYCSPIIAAIRRGSGRRTASSISAKAS